MTSLSIPFGRSHSYRYAKGTPEGNAFSVQVAYGYARTAPKGMPRWSVLKVSATEGIPISELNTVHNRTEVMFNFLREGKNVLDPKWTEFRIGS